MNQPPLDILHEDNHLLIVNKPAGVPTQGALPGEPNLCDLAKEYLKQKYQKPGNVYLGVVSRVDSFVTGAVVFARTSKAAARLSEQFRTQAVEKIYWAIVERPPIPPTGVLEDFVLKDDDAHRMRVVASHQGGQLARLSYRTLQQIPVGILLEVRLETGRKHQIRLQLAERGWPIVGDRKYGARSTFPEGIALHSRYLRLEHPVKHEPLEVTAPLPFAWRSQAIENLKSDI